MISTDAGHFEKKYFGRFLLQGLLCLSSSILACHLWGFKYGIYNNEFHTIIVDKIAKGIRFPGDAMAASMGNFPSPFWYVVAQCSKIVPAPIVFQIFYLVAWVLLNVGVSSMIAALTMKKDWILPWVLGSYAILSIGFIMNLPLGSDSVILPYLSQTFVSVGLCLLSISLTLENNNGWSAAVLGVAYNNQSIIFFLSNDPPAHSSFVVAMLVQPMIAGFLERHLLQNHQSAELFA